MMEIVTFIMRNAVKDKDGKVIGERIIHPWKSVRNLRGYEWLKEPEWAVLGEVREIPLATYIATREKEPVFLAGFEAPYTHQNIVIFQDDNNGRTYEIAERLAKTKKLKLGDKVRLEVLGCCSIMDIKKLSKSEIPNEW
jgi:hypothetical protein